MIEAVVTIHGKDSDKFEGQSKGSAGCFNINHEFLKRNIPHLNQTSIKKLYEKDIEGLYMEPNKTFLVLFDSIKLNIFNINDPV